MPPRAASGEEVIDRDDASTYTIRSIQEMLGLSRGVISGLIACRLRRAERAARATNTASPSGRGAAAHRGRVAGGADLAAQDPAAALTQAAARRCRPSCRSRACASARSATTSRCATAARSGTPTSGQLVMDFEFAPGQGQRSPSCSARRAPAAMPSRPACAADARRCRALQPRRSARGERSARPPRPPYRQVLALDPDHADAYLNLGALLCERPQLRRGGERSTTRRCAASRGKRCSTSTARSRSRTRVGSSTALASYHASLRLAPDLADAHYNAARLHEQLGDAKKAVRHLNAYRRLAAAAALNFSARRPDSRRA